MFNDQQQLKVVRASPSIGGITQLSEGLHVIGRSMRFGRQSRQAVDSLDAIYLVDFLGTIDATSVLGYFWEKSTFFQKYPGTEVVVYLVNSLYAVRPRPVDFLATIDALG